LDLYDSLTQLIKTTDLDQTRKMKLLDYVDLVLADKNQFYSTEELLRWIDEIRLRSSVEIKEKDIGLLKNWIVDPIKGYICHASGEFFKIIGIEIKNAQREVSGWDQPMIYQKEMGILGILRCKFNGINHYLLNAKIEAGNVFQYQISPTLQATYSNLKRAHGGKKPKFSEHFVEENGPHVVYKQWLTEDGGRFYLKTNLNMLVE